MRINTKSHAFQATAIGLAVFGLVMIFLIFPVNSLYITTPFTKINNPNLSPNIQNGPITTGTLVNTTKVLINNANVSGSQQFFDSIGCKNNLAPICSNSSPKFLLNVQSVLLDSNQKQYPQSTYVNVPALSILPTSLSFLSTPFSVLSGQQTFPAYTSTGTFLDNVHTLSLFQTSNPNVNLDLGSVQVVFYGVVPQDTNVIAYGDYAVYLDDQLRANGHFAGQGQTTNQQLQLAINNLPALTFTFSNEGANWQNGTQHIYRIMVGNITATTGSGVTSASFSYPKTSLAYILVMTLNNSKKTILGADNQAIAVFKSDGMITLNARSATWGSYTPSCTFNCGGYSVTLSQTSSATTVSANVYVNGFLITSGSAGGVNYALTDSNGNTLQGGNVITGTVSNIPRDSDIVIKTVENGKNLSYSFHTPVTQQSYNLDCSGTLGYADPNHPATSPNIIIFNGCSNNFPVVGKPQ